jgi:hypothetical protein
MAKLNLKGLNLKKKHKKMAGTHPAIFVRLNCLTNLQGGSTAAAAQKPSEETQ